VVEAIELGCGEQYWQQVAVMACNGCIKEVALRRQLRQQVVNGICVRWCEVAEICFGGGTRYGQEAVVMTCKR